MKLCIVICFTIISISMFAQENPFKIGVIGLSHSHVHWILGDMDRQDIEVVGIVEPNQELAQQYADQYGYSMTMVYKTMDELLSDVRPEAVTAFGSIFEHLAVVEKFAPEGIHIMVEKPLAVSVDHAKKMQALAKKHNVHLMTNYETTWYPTNHEAKALLDSDKIGDVRKVIIRDGHKGPKKIGINKEFLEWLTDPVLNGGGAIIDFGCYGANLMTWLMDGKKPTSVTAITQQLQVENNPNVDDEAIILLTYDNANAIIQASWNWPIGRKDMEVYGLTGAIFADNKNDLRVRIAEGYDGFDEEVLDLPELGAPYHDPFSYLRAIVRNEITPKPHSLSSLENNMIVVEILEAASISAKTGKSVIVK